MIARPAPDTALAAAVRLFNDREYFTFHEVLELIWIDDHAPDRDGWKGIIQAAVGYHHLRRGNIYGARQLWTRAVRYLEAVRPIFRGMDVDDLLQQVEPALRAVRLASGGPPPEIATPVLRLARSTGP